MVYADKCGVYMFLNNKQSLNKQRFNSNAFKDMLTYNSCISYLKSHIPKDRNSEPDVNTFWGKVKLPFLDVC